MTKTGKELNSQTKINKTLKEEHDKFPTITSSEDGKKLILTHKTNDGDEVIMTFNSPRREKYANTAKVIWSQYITSYVLLPEKQIYLHPNDYWNIYKKILFGKEIINGTGNSMWINGEQYTFVQPEYYFTTINAEKSEQLKDKGIYGIYYNDELLYIGSSARLESRWKEHDMNFRTHASINRMYLHKEYEPDKIEYKVLESGNDIAELIDTDDVPNWILQLIEAYYIKFYQPKYNIEGTAKHSFRFSATSDDVPKDYWQIVKNLLTNESIKYEHQAQELLTQYGGFLNEN